MYQHECGLLDGTKPANQPVTNVQERSQILEVISNTLEKVRMCLVVLAGHLDATSLRHSVSATSWRQCSKRGNKVGSSSFLAAGRQLTTCCLKSGRVITRKNSSPKQAWLVIKHYTCSILFTVSRKEILIQSGCFNLSSMVQAGNPSGQKEVHLSTTQTWMRRWSWGDWELVGLEKCNLVGLTAYRLKLQWPTAG